MKLELNVTQLPVHSNYGGIPQVSLIQNQLDGFSIAMADDSGTYIVKLSELVTAVKKANEESQKPEVDDVNG